MDIQERIIIESFEMFVKYGIRSVTMDDIAKTMGISKKTIYENFRDKNDLLEKGIMLHKQMQERNIEYVNATSKNVLEAIYRIMFDTISNLQKVNPAFYVDLKKYHSKLCSKFVPQHEKEQEQRVVELIKKGKEDGIFRISVNERIAAALINYQLKALSEHDAFPLEEFSIIELFQTMIENFTRGMATTKGIKIIEQIIEDKEKETKK